jgi:plastocyanin
MREHLFLGRLARCGLALLIASLFGLAGCGKSSSGGGTPTPSAGTSSPTITIQSFAFHGDLNVTPGARVTVRNADSVAHTLTAKDGSFDTGSIAGGGVGSFTAPSKPGSYPIGCTFHASMAGTLVVGSAAASSDTSGGGGGY